MALHKLDLQADVRPGYLKAFDIAGRRILLACGELGPVAIEDFCPHAGTPLSGGRVIGHRLRCPNHGYMFDLATGECARGRREGFGSLVFFELKVVGDHLAIEA